jgi:hypothetical protein
MSISNPASPRPDDHDPELSRILDRVTLLGMERLGLGPDSFLERASELQAEFTALARYRADALLSSRLEQFVQHRFDLVDDASEYALAAHEAFILSLVLDGQRRLVVPALRRAILLASGHLLEEGMPQLFGQLLKRLRTFARTENDPDLKAWVDGVVRSLPAE